MQMHTELLQEVMKYGTTGEIIAFVNEHRGKNEKTERYAERIIELIRKDDLSDYEDTELWMLVTLFDSNLLARENHE